LEISDRIKLKTVVETIGNAKKEISVGFQKGMWAGISRKRCISADM
jgi:hypothetical protein